MSTGINSSGAESFALVGRTREIDYLRLALSDALSGRGRIVLLAGESGIGKTRLAEELATHARASDVRVIWGRCWEGGGAPPYWPWIQILRECMGLIGTRSTAPEIENAVENIFHVLSLKPSSGSLQASAESTSESPDSGPPGISPPALRLFDAISGEMEPARFRLFDSVSIVLKRAALVAPLLILIEDLHWSDSDSLLLLKFIARDLRQCRVMLVGTCRDIELQSPQQSAILGDVAREGRCIQLPGLTPSETGDLIANRAGAMADSALVSSLHRATDGNPFFIEEIVHQMILEGRLHSSGKMRAAFPITEGVRGVTRRGLSALPEETRSVLTAASMIGQEFDLVTLNRVLAIPTETLIDSLDHARKRGVVAEVGGTPGRFRFAHAIIPDAMRTDIAMSEAMLFHRRIAEAMEELHGGDPGPHLAELAHHFSEALPLGGADKAVKYARLGAHRARGQLAYEEAARLNQMALRALEAQPHQVVQRCEILLSLGEAQSNAGNLAEAQQSFQSAAALAREVGRSDLLARAAIEASGSCGTFFEVNPSIVTLLEEAAAAVDDSEAAVRASVLARLAHELRWSDRRDYAIALCTKAIDLARKAGDKGSLVSALWTEFELYWGPENLEKRLVTATEIAALSKAAGYDGWLLRAHEIRLSALFELGDIQAADAEMRAAEELKSRVGPGFAVIERFRATRAILKGDFSEAETLIHQLMREAQRRQDVTLLTSFGAMLIMIRSEQGRMAEMEGTLKESVARFPTMLAARCGLGLFYARTGREVEARGEFEYLARDGFGRIPRDWNWLNSLAICAEICAALRDEKNATILYDLLLKYADRNVTLGWGNICYGSVARYLGMLAAVTRRFAESDRHFEAALRFELNMGAEPFAARTRVGHASMLLERGQEFDRAEALELAQASLATASRLGMAGLERQANTLIARASPGEGLGTSPPSVGRDRKSAVRKLATIMFLDIVDSTSRVVNMGDAKWSGVLNEYYAVVRAELRKFHGAEVNTFGDDFFALFDTPAHAISCARAIRDALLSLDLKIRAGIHTGECELSEDKVAGIAVHIGARIARKANPGEIVVSGTVRDLTAGAGFDFADRGIHSLVGVPGDWHLFAAA